VQDLATAAGFDAYMRAKGYAPRQTQGNTTSAAGDRAKVGATRASLERGSPGGSRRPTAIG
jgi:hypothetical protein